MFCPECGNQLSENQKFCDECGTKIPIKQPKNGNVQWEQRMHQEYEPCSASTEGYGNKTIPQSGDVYAYMDKYIRETTAFSSAVSLIDGAQPLRNMWIILLILCFFIGSRAGLAGLAVTFLILFATSGMALSILLLIRHRKTYTTWGRSVNIDDLTSFLEKYLYCMNFTAWKRGNPYRIPGLTVKDQYVIACQFNNKTYHHICFDMTKPGNYRIETVRTTAKEGLKDVVANHYYHLLYKNDYIVRPILEAATKYYFRYMAE